MGIVLTNLFHFYYIYCCLNISSYLPPDFRSNFTLTPECSQFGNSKINIVYCMLYMSECSMKFIANGWLQSVFAFKIVNKPVGLCNPGLRQWLIIIHSRESHFISKSKWWSTCQLPHTYQIMCICFRRDKQERFKQMERKHMEGELPLVIIWT